MSRPWAASVHTFIIAIPCALLASSSCGRQPIQNIDEPIQDITFEGAFSDWNTSVNSFAGGLFALMDANTNEVFSAEIKSGAFKIQKVPSDGRYYGMLIGPDYQVRATLQKKLQDNKTIYNVFRAGNTVGQLGTLVINDAALSSSQQSDLDFQTTLGANSNENAQKQFNAVFSTNFNANPDIDGDGIPNMIDSNVDGDKLTNIIDKSTYGGESLEDAKIAWTYNYGHAIPKTGYFNCSQLKSPVAATSFFKYDFWCTLKLPAGTAEKVTLKSTGLNIEMADDGGIQVQTHSDPIANDGVWTARFSIDGSKTTLFPNQLVMAAVQLKNGQSKSYLTLIGPEFPYAADFKKDPTSKQLSVTLTKSNLKVDVVLKNWPQDEHPKGVTLEVLLLNEDDSFIKSFTDPIGKGENAEDDATASKFTLERSHIDELGLSSDKKYKLKARVLGPAPLPGLVGSGTETAATDALQLPFPTSAP
jgi:hypothetical protein